MRHLYDTQFAHSLLYLQDLECSMAHGRCSVNAGQMSKLLYAGGNRKLNSERQGSKVGTRSQSFGKLGEPKSLQIDHVTQQELWGENKETAGKEEAARDGAWGFSQCRRRKETPTKRMNEKV